jgi:crotonobetainyl-CoA:carnitine CoA-transferase CaiB-like acyl-CoA transferase
MSEPLAGVRVLDLSRLLPGPFGDSAARRERARTR